MSRSTAHACNKPDCKAFTAPRFKLLKKETCLTVVRGNQSEHFAYYSQKKNILAPYRAPKPLLFVPESAVATGLEPGDDQIKLNKVTRQGSVPAQKRNRSGEKAPPSNLRFELQVDEEQEVVPSSPAKEETALELRDLNLATSSSSSDAPATADENAPPSTSSSTGTTTNDP